MASTPLVIQCHRCFSLIQRDHPVEQCVKQVEHLKLVTIDLVGLMGRTIRRALAGDRKENLSDQEWLYSKVEKQLPLPPEEQAQRDKVQFILSQLEIHLGPFDQGVSQEDFEWIEEEEDDL